MSELQEVTLTTVGSGAAEELFQHELKKVLKDIADPNKPATGVRKITLVVSITPTENREGAKTSIDCNGSVAKMKPAEGVIYFGKKGTELVAMGADPSQMKLDLDKPTVVEGGAANASS